jgi:hypothetical protein
MGSKQLRAIWLIASNKCACHLIWADNSLQISFMCLKSFLYLIRDPCDHPDCLSDELPRFREVSEQSGGVSGISDDLTHLFKLLLHSHHVSYNRLSLYHTIILVLRPDDADFAWISRFECTDEYAPCVPRLVCLVNCGL